MGANTKLFSKSVYIHDRAKEKTRELIFDFLRENDCVEIATGVWMHTPTGRVPDWETVFNMCVGGAEERILRGDTSLNTERFLRDVSKTIARYFKAFLDMRFR